VRENTDWVVPSGYALGVA